MVRRQITYKLHNPLLCITANQIIRNSSNQSSELKQTNRIFKENYLFQKMSDAVEMILIIIECLSPKRSTAKCLLHFYKIICLFVCNSGIDFCLTETGNISIKSIWNIQDTIQFVYECFIYMIRFHELKCRTVHSEKHMTFLKYMAFYGSGTINFNLQKCGIVHANKGIFTNWNILWFWTFNVLS